jgi:hypothetical protein
VKKKCEVRKGRVGVGEMEKTEEKNDVPQRDMKIARSPAMLRISDKERVPAEDES